MWTPPGAGLDLWSAGTHSGSFFGGDSWISQVPGVTPVVVCRALLTPVGLLAPGQYGAGVLPPHTLTGTTPTTRTFRGSITRPSASLSTLRRRPYGIRPRKTRFRLVASLCRAGFTPAGSPTRGFRSVDDSLHRFPLSQASPGAPRVAPTSFYVLPSPPETFLLRRTPTSPVSWLLSAYNQRSTFLRERRLAHGVPTSGGSGP